MVQYKTEAIVLRLREYREADSLVTLLTKEKGKVTAVAKGVYKPASSLRGGVQPYSINEMMLDAGRSELHTLLQSQCVEMLLPLRQSYDALTLGAYWAELLENFGQEGMAENELYYLAKAGFLGLAVNAGQMMSRALEVRLIQQQGISPDFEFCCRCGGPLVKDRVHFFSGSEGGFLCGPCAKESPALMPVGPAVIRLWRVLENLGLDKLSRLVATEKQLADLSQVLRQWIMRHTGRPMKTWPMINKWEG
jgi:DNA repair protein RecO (recombination protein O)